MLTSFETFDALTASNRSLEDVVEIIHHMAHHAIGFTPKLLRPTESGDAGDQS